MRQTHAAKAAAAERAWHLEQVLSAPLTERAREEHRDQIAWLDQHYDLCRPGVREPTGAGSPKARRKGRRRPGRRVHQRQAFQAG